MSTRLNRIQPRIAAAAVLSVAAFSCGAAETPLPPGAAALGCTVKVMDEHPTAADIAPNNANNGLYKWFSGPWWNPGRPSTNLYDTVNGDLVIRYDSVADKGGCLIGTPRDLSKGALPWLDGDKCFYIEFDVRLSDNDPYHWPAVWMMPVEHSGGSGNGVHDVYPGDPAGYERWMELDVDEGSLAKSGGAMCSVISWTGAWDHGQGYKRDITNNWSTGEALDRTQVHTFGASYDPFKRQVTSWVDGRQQWQTPTNFTSVPEIAVRQHFFPMLSVWRQDKGTHKPYSMSVSGVRAYVGTNACVQASNQTGASAVATDTRLMNAPGEQK